MRLNFCPTILHVSILAALLVRLDADSEDCEGEIRLRQNKVYKASVGEELRINCPVVFCNKSPPTVSWFKGGKTCIPVNVSSSSHIKTEWEKLDNSHGISYLVFKKILMSDSGEYQCWSGGSVSHDIHVSVSGSGFSPYAYRVAGIVAFLIVVMIIYVVSRSGCKVRGVRCARGSREPPDLSPHHIYENDP